MMDARGDSQRFTIQTERNLVALNAMLSHAEANQIIGSPYAEMFREIYNTLGNHFELTKAQGVLSEQGGYRGGKKLLWESKVISDLKTLASDRDEWKEWNNKLVTAIVSVKGPAVRKFFQDINARMNISKKVLEKEVY